MRIPQGHRVDTHTARKRMLSGSRSAVNVAEPTAPDFASCHECKFYNRLLRIFSPRRSCARDGLRSDNKLFVSLPCCAQPIFKIVVRRKVSGERKKVGGLGNPLMPFCRRDHALGRAERIEGPNTE